MTALAVVVVTIAVCRYLGEPALTRWEHRRTRRGREPARGRPVRASLGTADTPGGAR